MGEKNPTPTKPKQQNKKGLWDVLILDFPSGEAAGQPVIGGSALSNLQVPRSPKAQPLACPSQSTTSLHLLGVRGKEWPYSCWKNPAAPCKTQALPRGRMSFPPKLSLCCQYNKTNRLPVLPT